MYGGSIQSMNENHKVMDPIGTSSGPKDTNYKAYSLVIVQFLVGSNLELPAVKPLYTISFAFAPKKSWCGLSTT